MYVMYHIICSFSSDFVSNLKMAIRAETCTWDIYIADNIVAFKTVIPSHNCLPLVNQHNEDDSP